MKKNLYFILLVFLCLDICSAQTRFTSNLLFVAKLEGDQVNPPVTTSAVGESSFLLNETHDTVCINLTVKGLSGPLTTAHINLGPVGGNGPVTLDLTPAISGQRISMIMTAPQLTPIVINRMLNNEYYVEVGTASNPNGELRGQIGLETDIALLADLNGAQETPPVTTNGNGLATFMLSTSKVSLHIKGIFNDLSGPITQIHLHRAPVDTAGMIVQDLFSGLNGNHLDITVDPTAYLTDLLNGNIYINAHTQLNPDGEIRGQVEKQNVISFDAALDGAHEVPPVITPAYGVGMFSMSKDMDTLRYNFISDSLSSASVSAHFHTGPEGVSGPVRINLTSGLSGNRLQGFVTAPDLDSNFVSECLRGNIYVNIHTTNNPNGEIRGQMKRLPREGFTYSINGAQETPPTSSPAVGSGMASIDRDADNLHFRMIVTGLSGPLTSAHFHRAPAGFPGPIIFDLTQYFSGTGTDDAAFNYWMNNNGFDSSVAALFMMDSIYVNIHTALNPDGEVRGQVIQGSNCSDNITGINAIAQIAFDYNVYPNPTSGDVVNVEFTGLHNGNAQFDILDMGGRIVFSKEINYFAGVNINSFTIPLQSGFYISRLSFGENQKLISKMIRH